MSRHRYDLQFPSPVLGIDEVGLGALAGPITVCGVVLPEDRITLELLEQLDAKDSKRMTASTRELVSKALKDNYVWYFIAEAPADSYKKGKMGVIVRDLMHEVIREAEAGPGFGTCIIDGTQDRDLPDERFRTIAKADDLSLSVACASILAKVHRDEYMIKLAKEHPGYDFANNMGYGTPKHFQGLETRGPIRGVHRMEVKLIRKLIDSRPELLEAASNPRKTEPRRKTSFSVARPPPSGSGRFH